MLDQLLLNRLKEIVELPETHRQLLGDFDGGYSLGVGVLQGQYALFLDLEGELDLNMPRTSITVDGKEVVVKIQKGYGPAVAF